MSGLRGLLGRRRQLAAVGAAAFGGAVCYRSTTTSTAPAKDGTGIVWTWGSSGFGQLGHGSEKVEGTPRSIDSLTSKQPLHIAAYDVGSPAQQWCAHNLSVAACVSRWTVRLTMS